MVQLVMHYFPVDQLATDSPPPPSASPVSVYMKMHSYLTTNTEFESARRKVAVLKNQLESQITKRHAFNSEDIAGKPVDEPESPRTITRRRRSTVRRASDADSTTGIISPRDVAQSPLSPGVIGDIAVEMQELEKELTKGNTTYPQNQTFANFIDYLLVPTLVYELEYPRTEKLVDSGECAYSLTHLSLSLSLSDIPPSLTHTHTHT